MAKAAKVGKNYVCQNCGASSGKWVGRCGACGEWNTLIQESVTTGGIGAGPKGHASRGNIIQLETLKDPNKDGTGQADRMLSGIAELNRVTGGGLVPGSAILVGGDPGIGKSTLLLQVAAKLADNDHKAFYFSGEEATAQIRLRAERLNVQDMPVHLAAETNLANILATLEDQDPPDLIIIDSIQTLWSDLLDSAPGTVSQVRACTQALIRLAKKTNTALMIVGHVTKDGQIAGPKVVEHMVDTVLYFEGDRGQNFRILRAVKNRFGPTDEIGVFEMRNEGLTEVANPSELFLSEREEQAPGSAVFAGMEGTRPVLVEIQALVAPTSFATPKRAVVGWDPGRLSMILAVLQARCGLQFGTLDVYLNVAGGLKIVEPAADLAVAAALVSALANVPLSNTGVYCGEVSLSGAVRSVHRIDTRLKEAKKLGFDRITLPAATKLTNTDETLTICSLNHLIDLTAEIAARKN
ncbi:MAG: DNA repair protein RadA [Pseudomonadota bacterium]